MFTFGFSFGLLVFHAPAPKDTLTAEQRSQLGFRVGEAATGRAVTLSACVEVRILKKLFCFVLVWFVVGHVT